MRSRVVSALIVITASLAFSSALHAQQAREPALDEILRRLEANLHHYDTSVPSLFCDEHAVSRVWPGAPNENTITDSIFRLKRTPQPNHTTTLVESREIQKIDGKPAISQKFDGPTLLNGAFEGALAVVSIDQIACMNYSLEPIKRRGAPYVIQFFTVATPRDPAACLLQENSKGRAFVDPTSMQLIHLELITPRHVVVPGDSYTSPVVGKRVVNVDYAPVPLGGEAFWMPSRISLRTTTGSRTFHMIVWSFQATYRNYHKLEVTSRILPGSETPVQ